MRILRERMWLSAAVLVVMSFATITAHAHEGLETGDYNINIGWIEEPTYEGFKNGVELRVTKAVEGDLTMPEPTSDGAGDHGETGHHESAQTTGEDAEVSEGDHDSGMGVTGLEQTLRVEVTHTATAASRVLDLRADALQPGRYTADLIPTAPGVYEFRIFGEIEGTAIDEVFTSIGGGGGFDDVRPASSLQFPVTVSSLREMESAVRGAVTTAESAQDTAAAAQASVESSAAADDDGSSPDTLAVVAIVLSVVAVSLAAGSMIMARVRK